MGKIKNEKIETDECVEDYLTTILNIEKNMGVNLVYALNEASNEALYERLFDIFETVKDMQRNIYETMFRCGFYEITEASDKDVKNEVKCAEEKLKNI